MKANVTVIFPMAGQGVRFGGTFKPFLNIGETTFIQRAVSSFAKHREQIKEFIFIFLQEQEVKYAVTKRLQELFSTLNYRIVILSAPTKGPAETVRLALQKERVQNSEIIICDCDHYLDVAPLFHYVEEHKDDCVIPLWNLRGENIKAWSVAALSDDGRISGIAEKELPRCPGSFFGVIGCYYFRDAAVIIANEKFYLSEIIRDLINFGKHVAGAQIVRAEFFGDPDRLQNALEARKKKVGTIFCDVDGTLIEHEDFPDYSHPLNVLPGALQKLQEWSQKGYAIIFSTSRQSEHEIEFRAALEKAQLHYDRLLMDLPSGPRFVINDRKPSAILTPHAIAFEIERNQGINQIEIDSVKPNILKLFKGGSLSKTLLIEDNGKLFVRKVVSKDKSVLQKYLKLKRQYSDLQRLTNLCPEVIPELYGESENSFEYFYDMAFYPDHDLLSKYSTADKLKAIKLLLKKMSVSIYKQRAYISEADSLTWLSHHFADKIYPKLSQNNLPPALFSLVNCPSIINGQQFPSLLVLLQKILEPANVNSIRPTYLCPIHGDLTFENILYRSSGYNLATNSYEPSLKLVDIDTIDLLDPPEIDLGKTFQSVVSQYESWSTQSELLSVDSTGEIHTFFTPEVDLVQDLPEYIAVWSNVIEGENKTIEIKGYFYMGLHLLRMVPFRLAVSHEQALFALVSAVRAFSQAMTLIQAEPRPQPSVIATVVSETRSAS